MILNLNTSLEAYSVSGVTLAKPLESIEAKESMKDKGNADGTVNCR